MSQEFTLLKKLVYLARNLMGRQSCASQYLQALILVSFVALPNVWSEETARDEKKSDYVICKNKKTIRTIRIDNVFDKETKRDICVTTYTKSGVDKEVGRASNKDSCAKILQNIRVNLSSADWQCKDVDNAGFTVTETAKVADEESPRAVANSN